MLKLFYFVIPLIFAVCLSISQGNYGYGSYPVSLCSDDSTLTGYCVDCETLFVCNNGVNVSTQVCTDEQACRVSEPYAACSDISTVSECNCPSDETVQNPDPYDDRKYFICSGGIRYEFECPGDEHYNPDTQQCYTPSTTTPTTTTPNPCDGQEGVQVKVNCTCYRYCLGGNNYVDDCCDLGEIYNDDTDTCEFYSLFTCLGKTNGVNYVDPHNCSIYYLCVDDDIFASSICPDEEAYDEAAQACSATASCNSIPDCGICEDEDTFIKIDCQNYYDCQLNEDADEDEPEFTPVPKTCPEGTCFNQQTTFCDLIGQSHWSFPKFFNF